MKQLLRIGILSLLVFISCKTENYIITTQDIENLNVYKNDTMFCGTISPGDSLALKGKQKVQFSARKNDYFGYISFDNINRGKRDNKGNSLPNTTGVIASSKAKLTNIEEVKLNDTINVKQYYVTFYMGQEQVIPDNSKFGYLKLTSNENDVEIYIDDEFSGLMKDGLYNKKYEIGKHTIMAKKEFFMPNTIKFELIEKDVFQYHFELVKVKGWFEETPGSSTAKQARGNLTIVTERTDYVISIEGHEKIPPIEIKNAPAGRYNVVVKRPDFEKKIEVTIEDGKTEFIDLDEMFK